MGQKKSAIDILARGMEGDPRQQAEAIATFVDGRINGLREELTTLVGQQKANIEVAKAEGSPEAAAAANEGSAAANEAKAAVKEAEADPTPEKVEQATGKVKKAKLKVAEAESELAAMVAKHDNELYNEDNGVLCRLKRLEENQTGLTSSVEGLWVKVQANAKAIAFGTTAGLARIARMSTGVFGIGVLLWLLVVLVFDKVTLGNSWSEGLGLAAIAAGLVYIVQASMLDGRGRSRNAQAEAEANAGVDIVRGPRPMTEAEAEASAAVASRH